MLRIGRISVWVGVLLAATGLITGFALMLSDQSQSARFFLTLIPIGFLLMLTGVVTAFLAQEPEKPRDPE
jgi:ABC-type transport system involved in cytochrome c biogenesis permease subunit